MISETIDKYILSESPWQNSMEFQTLRKAKIGEKKNEIDQKQKEK